MSNETNPSPPAQAQPVQPQPAQQTSVQQPTQTQNQPQQSVPQEMPAQSPPPPQEQTSSNAPIDTLRDGALKVSIFKNERESGTNYSLDQGRIYTDSQGQIQEAKTLSGTEPLRMARLLERAYDRVGEFRAEMKQAKKSELEK